MGVHKSIGVWIRGEEKGEERIPFLHKDLAKLRRQVTREWLITTTVLCAAILAILSIFWGVFIHTEHNLGALVVWIVNFDDGDDAFVGPHVVDLVKQLISSPFPHVGFEVRSASSVNYDPLELRRHIYDFDAWAAICVNPNATARLREAVVSGSSAYDPNDAAQVIYVGARDTDAMPNYVVPALNDFMVNAVATIGRAWVREIISNTSISRTSLLAVPQAVNPAIGFTTINLRPFGPAQVTPSVTVGTLYLIVLSFFSFSFFLPTHTHFVSEMEGHGKLYFHHLVMWKYLSTFCAYFFMSLAFSLVSLAFQIPFSNSAASPIEPAANPNAYGKASFAVFWMVNWIGMLALGFASENMAMVLGLPWAALWLVFWIIANVCTAFYPIELAPQFYYYGYAFPLHNLVEASRQILFDLHSRIGLNVGVLLAWWATNTTFYPFCAWYFRWKHLKEAARRRR